MTFELVKEIFLEINFTSIDVKRPLNMFSHSSPPIWRNLKNNGTCRQSAGPQASATYRSLAELDATNVPQIP